jgi:hypothetical protein
MATIPLSFDIMYCSQLQLEENFLYIYVKAKALGVDPRAKLLS